MRNTFESELLWSRSDYIFKDFWINKVIIIVHTKKILNLDAVENPSIPFLCEMKGGLFWKSSVYKKFIIKKWTNRMEGVDNNEQ